ncbi:MAG: hypothetical protein GX620_12920 [Chloroflexi bacterium]|nr:hypothetical protein [Chloroflexota bacterium]
MTHQRGITKRLLGWLLIGAGIAGDVSILLIGRLGGGAWQGIGPLEGALLLGGLIVAALGIPLLRLGDQPAATQREPSYPITSADPDTTVPWALRRGTTVLQAIALTIFFAYLAVYVTYAVDLFRWPYDYDQGESFELYDAVLHSRGEWPYRDSSTYPFYASNYPPVFHLLNVLLFPVFGKTLLSGRVLSFTITLLTAVAIGLTVRRRTAGLFVPIISGLAYLASNFVYHIGPLCRQHLTMVFLEVLAVAFIAGVEDSPPASSVRGRRNLVLGLACLFLAGYAKQLAVFTAVAIFAYLFLRHPLRAIGFAAAFGAVFGLAFVIINLLTDGHWWINTIAANVNAYLLPQLVGLAQSWLKIHTLFVVGAVAMVLYETYVGRISVYSLWFVAALGTAIMSGKWGAGEAYWVSSVAAAIILTGFALGGIQSWLPTHHLKWRSAVALAVPLLYILQGTRMLHLPTEGVIWGDLARLLGVSGRSAYADYPYYDAVGYSQVGHLMLTRDYEGGARIMAHVRQADGPVLSEEAAFTMLGGKPVVTNPTQLLNLYNNGMLDTSELEAMLRREEFGLVIMRAQFYPPPVLAAIGEHYGLVEHIPMNGFNYIIMKPLGQPVP